MKLISSIAILTWKSKNLNIKIPLLLLRSNFFFYMRRVQPIEKTLVEIKAEAFDINPYHPLCTN